MVHKKLLKRAKSTVGSATKSVSRFGRRTGTRAGRFVARRARGVGTAAGTRGRRVARSVGGRVSLGARGATRSLTSGARQTFRKTIGRISTKKGPGLRKLGRTFAKVNPIRGIRKTTSALRSTTRLNRTRNRRRPRR